MGLPEPCAQCAPQGGNWRLLDYGVAATARCDCPRGRALTALDQAWSVAAVRGAVRISEETATICVGMLSSIPWFPLEPSARLLIAETFQSMCNEDAEAFWLAKRTAQLFSRWPGIVALRLVFCSRFIPLDHLAPVGICEAYPDGIPAESEPAPPSRLALPPGQTASIDPVLEMSVRQLARAKDLNNVGKRVLVAEIPVNPDAHVTQAMIDEAVKLLHEQRATDAANTGPQGGTG